jgi:hypothetical protein
MMAKSPSRAFMPIPVLFNVDSKLAEYDIQKDSGMADLGTVDMVIFMPDEDTQTE